MLQTRQHLFCKKVVIKVLLQINCAKWLNMNHRKIKSELFLENKKGDIKSPFQNTQLK